MSKKITQTVETAAFRSRSTLEWSAVLFVILVNSAVASELVPLKPWGMFLQTVVSGLFAWGLLARPKPVAGEA